MIVRLSFSAMGHVKQTVTISKPGITQEDLIKGLNDGTISTSERKGGTVDITANGEIIGTVTSVDNNLEYSDFELI